MKIFKMFPMIALWAIAVCVMVSCGSTTDSTPADPTKSADIAGAALPTAVTGGDIRGFYAPNSPFVWATTTIPGATITTPTQNNSGSGTIKFEGTSANSGTYTATGLTFNLKGNITASVAGQTTTVGKLEDLGTGLSAGLGSKSTGTWSVTNNALTLDNIPVSSYTVDSKGLYLILTSSTAFGAVSFTLAFKK